MVKRFSRIAVIAAVYVALTVLLVPISFYAFQVRIAEALTVLPFLFPEAIWGLFIGCFIANFFGGLGLVDVIVGSLLTLFAAFLTHLSARTGKPYLAPLPPLVINAFGVSAYLVLLLEPPSLPFDLPPYLLFVISIFIGEAIATYGLGLPLLYFLKRKEWY